MQLPEPVADRARRRAGHRLRAKLADGVRESINRFAQPATAASLEVKVGALGLRVELLGAVSLAGQHALLEI